MNRFWQLLRESVIIQGFITIMTIGAIVVLAVTGRPIPEILERIVFLVVGFYFGSKTVTSARDSAIAIAQAIGNAGSKE